jgi:hypothetical protein
LFGPFTFSSVGLPLLNPLPVTLLSITGECYEGVTELKWVTASEQNNDYFLVDKSTNGYEYVNIGKVTGSGNSNVIRNYHFEDNESNGKLVYYRLSQVDFDGKKNELGVVAVTCKGNFDSWLAYMNANNHMVLSTNYSHEDNISIELYDMQGGIKWNSEHAIQNGFTECVFDISSLSAGVYIVRVTDSNGLSTQRLLKR